MSKRKNIDSGIVSAQNAKSNAKRVTTSQKANLTGRIKSVYCKHFVTYDECTFYPSEYLNLVIGPNGTGKSTLVSAIVLGLGGDPKLLNRATSVCDYIKNGRTDAKIVVEIHDNGKKSVSFCRTFNSEGDSEYSVNKEVLTKKRYLNAVAVYNIQISNLCQFLPQDRVQDFSKMNSQELLTNTIKSVCDQEFIDNFSKLKDLRKMQLCGKSTIQAETTKLKESTKRLEELQQVMNRFNARKEFTDKLQIYNAKKLWLDVENMKTKAKEYANDMAVANQKYAEAKKEYDGVSKKQSMIVGTTEKLKNDVVRKNENLQKVIEAKKNIDNQIDELKQKIFQTRPMLERQKRELEEKLKELRHETHMLVSLQQDLKNQKAIVDSERDKKQEHEQNLSTFTQQSQKYLKMRNDINYKLENSLMPEVNMYKNKIERLENVAAQKLQMLRNGHQNLHTAVLWLNENRHMFAENVYNPIMLELNIPDANNAKYFENSIRIRDLFAFTCENKSDMSLLINELCVKQKLGINVIYSAAADSCQFTPNTPIEKIAHLGFTSYLVDLVEGPAPILNYLCRIYRIHEVPIGNELVAKNTDHMPRHIRQYFGGNQRFNVSGSKYSNEISLMQIRISDKNLLCSVDINEKQSLENKVHDLLRKTDALKNERSSIEAKLNDIEYQRVTEKKLLRTIEAKYSELEQLKEKYKRQTRKVEHLNDNNTTIPELEKIFASKNETYIEELLKLHGKKINSLKTLQICLAEKNVAVSKEYIYKNENEELITALSEATDKQRKAKELVDMITNALATFRNKYKAKVNEAQRLTNNCKPNDANFPYKKEFSELTNDLEELTEAVNEFNARLDCMGDVDSEIVNNFNALSNEVEILKKKIQEETNSDRSVENNITDIYNVWQPELNKMIETLNTNFGGFMESMKYVGEVLLDKQEDFDFDSYGIKIMVQYRKNVALQALDKHVQSGGERAVAIAVYTLSLQQLSHVPFRCVDEINQGMDPRNERKILEMLFTETTKTGSSQYFFVTPKLLRDLNYNDRISVSIIHNGKSTTLPDVFKCVEPH